MESASIHPPIYDTYPAAIRDRLLWLRALILDVANGLDGVGPLEETLKWGEPSLLTSISKSGTTIRLNAAGTDGCSLYFNCKTHLVDTFRSLYSSEMTFIDDREIHFRAEDEIPETALRHCLALALTYHRWKAKGAPPRA